MVYAFKREIVIKMLIMFQCKGRNGIVLETYFVGTISLHLFFILVLLFDFSLHRRPQAIPEKEASHDTLEVVDIAQIVEINKFHSPNMNIGILSPSLKVENTV